MHVCMYVWTSRCNECIEERAIDILRMGAEIRRVVYKDSNIASSFARKSADWQLGKHFNFQRITAFKYNSLLKLSFLAIGQVCEPRPDHTRALGYD